MLKELKWKPLKDRRREIRLALLFKIVKGKVAVEAQDILVETDSRIRSSHHLKFRHITTKTKLYKHSYFTKTIPEWNKLPAACIEGDSAPAFLPVCVLPAHK